VSRENATSCAAARASRMIIYFFLFFGRGMPLGSTCGGSSPGVVECACRI
jgi:hypothetical protein